MLLETYKADGQVWLSNVLGTISGEKEAFRGDLVLELGDMHEASQTRNPPKKVFEQVVLLADGGKITFLSGFLEDIASLEHLASRYGGDMADGLDPVLFVLNIDKPTQVAIDGVTYACIPLSEGLVWNELMDLFYIEKSDLKGLSPEEKVATVAEARSEYTSKADVLEMAAAAALANGQVREYSGAI